MKKWKCSVCAYIHEGDAPPDDCPICKAHSSKFEAVTGERKEGRRWKCTICGYIHDGESPPDECPICKAGPDKFVEVDADGNELVAQEQPKPKVAEKKVVKEQPSSLLARFILKFHVHPISVHTPNGILPIAVIFLAISIFLGIQSLEAAAFYNMAFVLVVMPVVLLTGFIEWQNRYKGAKTFIFFSKIACSAIVTTTLVILVAWRFVDPGVALPDSPYRMVYLGIGIIMLVATGIAGNLGGKLVFRGRGR